LFAWTYQPNLLAIQQCFSLTTNQPTVLSAIAYQPIVTFCHSLSANRYFEHCILYIQVSSACMQMILKNLEGLSPEIRVTSVLIALAVISLEIWRQKHMKSQGNNLRKETPPYLFVDDMIVHFTWC